MSIIKKISYHTIHVDNRDEASSLAYYLNEHGVPAEENGEAVDVPVPDAAAYADIEKLKDTWQLFWEHSDTALFFGMPVYVKE